MQYADKMVTYTRDELDTDVTLAYAITIHKSQVCDDDVINNEIYMYKKLYQSMYPMMVDGSFAFWNFTTRIEPAY